MQRIRYLTFALVWLISCIASLAQGFDPLPPGEPGDPNPPTKLVVITSPSQGGTVSGEGRYTPGKSVTVRASVNTGFVFTGWTNELGEEVSKSTSYTFVKGNTTETLIAHFEFSPSAPVDPGAPTYLLYYKLTLKAGPGGTVSGGGRYRAGSKVSIRATPNTGYSFRYWENEEGEVVSKLSSFTYTTKAKHETLTAHFEYEPNAPTEPGDPILRHNIVVGCDPGATVQGGGRILEGNSTHIYCYPNTGYRFVRWLKDGVEYTRLRDFSYTVGKEDAHFYAEVEFDPAVPAEPAMPAIGIYSYYLMTVNGMPGKTVEYPIYLTNKEVVNDVNIRLTFPAGLIIEPSDFRLADDATGYTVSIAEAHDDISIIEEGAQLYDFTLIGGTTPVGTHSLLTFKITIPEGFMTGGNHQVKINQVTMAMPDGTPVTARTRNGRIGVYEWGDSNGDGAVTVADLVTAIAHMQGKTPETFIEVVTDVNEDGTINVDDCSGIETIVLSK